MGTDLFGNEIIKHLSIKDRFIVPPFSILDGNSGDWMDRLRRWKMLNIKSEIGRNDNILFNQGLEKYMPNYNNTSIFDPVLCELMYRWFCPDSGLIIDPFAGGSVRGIVANHLGYKYTGIELRQEQVDSNREQAIEILDVNNQPQWYIGDSEQILNDLIPEYDFAFTCPPYFNLEVYSDLQDDLSTMTYEQFLLKYEAIITKTISKLKEDTYFVIVVGEVRDKQGYYLDFVGDTKKIFMRNGMKYYNDFVYKERGLLSAAFRVNNNFAKSKKNVKIHQNVIVFKKCGGDILNNFQTELSNVNKNKMKEFIQTLKELDFKYIPQEGCEGCDAWSKVYKGFILFIVKAPNGKLLASITVRQLEISLPNIPDEYWVIEFDRENT